MVVETPATREPDAQGATSDPLGPNALDFWLGEWALTWPGGGHGTNRIRRAVGGRVIEESFSGSDDSNRLMGRSLSVLNTADGIWRQTWVDSDGSYLDLVGVELDGRIAFQRTASKGRLQRMRWIDVAPDSLTWQWQGSPDNGITWNMIWDVRYQRMPSRRAARSAGPTTG